MGRSPCCVKEGLNKGAWTAMEDKILTDYIKAHGDGKWRSLPKKAGLKRCGKSCRLRWLNYLRPDIKRGNITPDEEELIVRLHKLLGNRWSLIAGRLRGRTDNEIKNYWNTNLSKRANKQQTSELPNEPSTAQPKKPRTDTTKKKARAIDEPIATTPPITSHVIRTKAVRCTKLFIEPPRQPSYDHTNNNAVNNVVQAPQCSREFSDGNCSIDHNSSMTLYDQENIGPSEIAMEEFTNMKDFGLISELLNSDFPDVFYLSNNESNVAHNNSIPTLELQLPFCELLENFLGDIQGTDFGIGQVS